MADINLVAKHTETGNTEAYTSDCFIRGCLNCVMRRNVSKKGPINQGIGPVLGW